MKRGRPSKFDHEWGNAVCKKIESGLSLRQVCQMEGMPNISTVMDWVRKNEDFATQYAKAREALLQHWADQIIDIADDSSGDKIEITDENGEVVETRVNTEHINRSRLRVDTRKWLLSKLGHKKYGDKLELSGTDGGPLIAVIKDRDKSNG